MEMLNHFAPAIQAVSAAVVAILTVALLVATWRYIETSEALQKPFVTVRQEPRDPIEAALASPNVAQVAQHPQVRVLNVGTGPALQVRYRFLQIDAPPGGPVMRPEGFVDYLPPGQGWETQVARGSLVNRRFRFEVKCKSLSGKGYRTEMDIENGVVQGQED